jgi:hypothetical protein
MLKEEETNDPEFGWWEKRKRQQVSLTVGSTTGRPFATTVAVTAGTTNDHTVSTFTLSTANFKWTAAANYGVAIVDDSLFRVGHVIRIPVKMTTGATGVTAAASEDLKGIIIAIDRTNHYLVFTAITSSTNYAIDYSQSTYTGQVGIEVKVIGSSFAQGVTSQTTEVYYLPVYLSNFTQIFRTEMSFTGSALVTPVKFDDTGIYKDKAKSTSMDHMVEMELAFLFGAKYRTATNVANATQPVPTTGVGLPQYTTGGILWFMQQWEAATGGLSITDQVASGASSLAYDHGKAAAMLDSDDNKRIIANASGYMTEKLYDTYLERLFRSSNNLSNEKLVLCGSGFLKVMNQMYRSQSTFVYHPPTGDTFGMEIVAHKTAFGTVYYKTHPLFNENDTLRNNALFMDVHNLRYRPMSKRDTQLLKNRQPNDADYRKDEWFTETGLEMRMPESFLYIQNVQDFTP